MYHYPVEYRCYALYVNLLVIYLRNPANTRIGDEN